MVVNIRSVRGCSAGVPIVRYSGKCNDGAAPLLCKRLRRYYERVRVIEIASSFLRYKGIFYNRSDQRRSNLADNNILVSVLDFICTSVWMIL